MMKQKTIDFGKSERVQEEDLYPISAYCWYLVGQRKFTKTSQDSRVPNQSLKRP
jgi:hypothetical protein